MWAGTLGEWLAPLPFTPEFRVRFPVSAIWKKQKMFLPHPRVKVSIVESLRDWEVACAVSDRQCPNFESCVRRAVSSHSSHHPQVLLAQFSLYVHKGGLKSIHSAMTPFKNQCFQQKCVGPMMFYGWPNVADSGPTINQRCVDEFEDSAPDCHLTDRACALNACVERCRKVHPGADPQICKRWGKDSCGLKKCGVERNVGSK